MPNIALPRDCYHFRHPNQVFEVKDASHPLPFLHIVSMNVLLYDRTCRTLHFLIIVVMFGLQTGCLR